MKEKKKTVVTVMREFIIESEGKLKGLEALEFIDLLRNIYNSDFSEIHIQKALQHYNPTIRTLTKEFLRKVEKET